MRERLIELIINADTYDEYACKLCNKGDDACDCCYAEKLADHLLANGVIVLPCKVGDVVYAERWNFGNVEKHQITNLMIAQNKKGNWTKKYRAMMFVNGKTIDAPLDFSFDEIGKKVFLTREEAKQAVKDMRRGDKDG